MRLNFCFQRYNSKLATIVSLLQSGIAGWIFFYGICCIPAFICLACDVGGAIVGALFGIMFVVSVVCFILFCKFVKPDKIEARAMKKKMRKYSDESTPEKNSNDERRYDLAMRSYIGSQISADNSEKNLK